MLVELGMRFTGARPPVQLIRGRGLHVLDGVPVWEESPDRQNRGCPGRHPERAEVLLLGSSITYGSGLGADEAFSHLLEEKLNEQQPTPGFCVLNFAQPGFSFEQKYAVAKQEVVRYRPALVLWESWVEWMDYAMIGRYAYGVTGYRLRSDGAVGIRGMPTGLNGFLFRNLRAYEYIALSVGEKGGLSFDDQGRNFAKERLGRVPALASSVGAKLAIYPATPLDRSFAETAASPPAWHDVIAEFGRSNGIPVYPLQQELLAEDPLKLRMDPCCHFNAQGHQVLAPLMARIVFETL